jgi:hypothetical protein
MKFIFIISLAAVVFAAFTYPTSKEISMYLGHAEYKTKGKDVCSVWPIQATNEKQADSLFRCYVDSCLKADAGTLIENKYGVWLIKSCLKINKSDYAKTNF